MLQTIFTIKAIKAFLIKPTIKIRPRFYLRHTHASRTNKNLPINDPCAKNGCFHEAVPIGQGSQSSDNKRAAPGLERRKDQEKSQ